MADAAPEQVETLGDAYLSTSEALYETRDALTTAQARIAELEAALHGCMEALDTELRERREGVWSEDMFAEELAPYRRALEAKP